MTLLLTLMTTTLLCMPSAWAGDIATPFRVNDQGQEMPTARLDEGVRDDKGDPGNLTAEQARRAADPLRTAPFGPLFKDKASLVDALFALQFPGHGLFIANKAGSLDLSYVELPWAKANRYLVIERQTNGSYFVVADFVASSEPEIVDVRRAPAGQLQFLTQGGTEVTPEIVAGPVAARAYLPVDAQPRD